MDETKDVSGDEFYVHLVARLDHLQKRFEKLDKYSKTSAKELNDDQLKALEKIDEVYGSLDQIRALKDRYKETLSSREALKVETEKRIRDEARKELEQDSLTKVAGTLSKLLNVSSKVSRNPRTVPAELAEKNDAVYSLVYAMFKGDEASINKILEYHCASDKPIDDTKVTYNDVNKFVTDYLDGAFVEQVKEPVVEIEETKQSESKQVEPRFEEVSNSRKNGQRAGNKEGENRRNKDGSAQTEQRNGSRNSHSRTDSRNYGNRESGKQEPDADRRQFKQSNSRGKSKQKSHKNQSS